MAKEKDSAEGGGPGFHPQMESIKKKGIAGPKEKTGKDAGQIVDDEDLPAVTPSNQNYGF